MDGVISELKSKKVRKEKTELESRSFKDGAIYLFKRADYKKPTWFCRVKVPNAKGYVSCSTKTTDEHVAFAFANDLFHKTLVSVANGRDLRSKKVDVALTEFVKHLSEVEKHRSTLHDKLLLLNRTKEFFSGKRLNEVNTKTLMELNDWLRERARNKTLSQTSIKRYTANLKQFFDWCVDQDHLQALPKLPKVRIEGNRRPHFDNKDWAKLTRHMREFVKEQPSWVVRDRTMLINYVLILANTGIRVGEARTLKWRDLREIPAAKGSNQPADIALFVTGKTGPREVVARTSDVKTYFKRILELRTKELGKSPSGDDYVFCNRDGTTIGSFKKSFAALLKGAGVETDSHGAKRTIYSLRHTYATFRLQEGVHQFILAKNMGTSTAMLEKHYGHTSNVASAAELTKGGQFKTGKKAGAVDWLLIS
jgi:integrase